MTCTRYLSGFSFLEQTDKETRIREVALKGLISFRSFQRAGIKVPLKSLLSTDFLIRLSFLRFPSCSVSRSKHYPERKGKKQLFLRILSYKAHRSRTRIELESIRKRKRETEIESRGNRRSDLLSKRLFFRHASELITFAI